MPDPQSASGRCAGESRIGRRTDGRAAASLVLRYGAEAANVIGEATCERPADPVADGIDVTRAEFEYAVTHEGALTVDDILDRRTRIGLVMADRERAAGAAAEFLSRFGGGERDTMERN